MFPPSPWGYPLYPKGIFHAFTIEGHVFAVHTHRQKWISRFSGHELLAGPCWERGPEGEQSAQLEGTKVNGQQDGYVCFDI
jgi:hypothetical protein